MAAKPRIREVLDGSSWDQAVWSLPNANIFSSWLWGEYKSRTGWRVHRLAVEDQADEPLALIQYHEKRKGFVRLIRVQGGPLLTRKGDQKAELSMGSFLDHLELNACDIVVLDFERTQTPAVCLAALACGFKPTVQPIRYTLDVDLTRGLASVREGMEPRWRKALRRAEQWPGLTARFLDDRDERLSCFDTFAEMYALLKTRAGFTNNFICSAYRDLIADDPHQLMLEVREAEDIVLIRIAHLSPQRCTDFFTASSERARNSNAATLAVWEIIRRASLEGCRTFDHGGIDPAGAPGVFDFKKGLTRNVVLSGPVWVYARVPLLRDLVGAYQAFG